MFNLQRLNGIHFSTRDRDYDKWSSRCEAHYVGNAGGWCYAACSYVIMNTRIGIECILIIHRKSDP